MIAKSIAQSRPARGTGQPASAAFHAGRIHQAILPYLRTDAGPDTALIPHRRHPHPARAPRGCSRRQPPQVFRDPETGAAGTCGRPRAGRATHGREQPAPDVTAFPEIGLATGACSGNGILLDISDPVNPGSGSMTWSTCLRPARPRRRCGRLAADRRPHRSAAPRPDGESWRLRRIGRAEDAGPGIVSSPCSGWTTSTRC